METRTASARESGVQAELDRLREGACVSSRARSAGRHDSDVAGGKLTVGENEQAEFVSASGGGRMSPNDSQDGVP